MKRLLATLFCAICCLAATKTVTRVIVEWSDGSSNVIIAPLPATETTAPVEVPAVPAVPATQPAATQPAPVVPVPVAAAGLPAWLDAPAAPRLSGNVLRAGPAELKAKLAAMRSGDTLLLSRGQVYDLGVLLGDALRVKWSDVRIAVAGTGANPKLLYDGSFQVVAVSGSRVLIEDIDVARKSGSGRHLTSGFSITGDDVRLSDISVGDIGELCFSIRPGAARVWIERAKNIGKTPGYFAYSNGQDVALIDCRIDRSGLHGFRANEAKDQYIGGCTFVGVAGGSGLTSLVVLGEVARAAIADCTFQDAMIVLGPNMNRDGLAQAGGDRNAPVAERAAILAAKRCENVTLSGNRLMGEPARINIGHGSVNITATGNTEAYRISGDGTLNAEGGTWPLPGAKNVVIDGTRVR